MQGTVEFLSIPHSDIVRKPEVLENEQLDEIFCIDILAKKRRPSSRPGAPLFRQCQGLTSAPGQYAEVGNSSARLSNTSLSNVSGICRQASNYAVYLQYMCTSNINKFVVGY